MKRVCSRMIPVLCLAFFSSFVYATKNFTARNATSVVQFAAMFSNLTVENSTGNSTVVSPYSPKYHKLKHKKLKHYQPEPKAWLQGRANGTLPDATKLMAKGRNATSGVREQPSGGTGSRKDTETKGGRKKGTGKKAGKPDASGAGAKTGGSRNTTVDKTPSTKPFTEQPGKRSNRPHSRSARREHISDQGTARVAGKGTGQAGENSFPVNKAGYPVAKKLVDKKTVPARKQRSPSGQPSIPIGNANFSIIGEAHDGRFHLVETVNRHQVHTPYHNATVPYSGELDSRGHHIAGLNRPLFGAVNDSKLDLVFYRPDVIDSPAGTVAYQVGSNNNIKVQVIGGTVNCSDPINCNTGLIAGELKGDNNHIVQHNSTGSAWSFGRVNPEVLENSGGHQRASLSLGTVEGNNNTLIQRNVSGNVIAQANTLTYTYANVSSDERTTHGTVVVAAAGPANIAGEGNTVIQENIDVNITSSVDGDTEREGFGIANGAQSLASLGTGVVEDHQFTSRQTKVQGHATAQARGDTSVCENGFVCFSSKALGTQAIATAGVAEAKSSFQQITQIDTEGLLKADASGEIMGHHPLFNEIPPTASRGAIIGRYNVSEGYDGGVLQLVSGNVSESVPVVGDHAGGYFSGGSFIDLSGYIVNIQPHTVSAFNTTQAFTYAISWDNLCLYGDYDCSNNGQSCHYVHEVNPSLVWLPNGDLALLSQQSYPYGSEADNANSVLKVTQFNTPNGASGANSTGDALPQLNTNVGFSGASFHEVVVPQRQRFSFPVSQVANGTHIHNLYKQNGGIRIASLPIAKPGSYENILSTYHTVDFNVTGQPLFLSENGSSLAIWMNNDMRTIDAYQYDGQDRLHLTASFDLRNSTGADNPVLAAGHNSDWLYVVRNLNDVHDNRVLIERFGMADKQPDSGFHVTLDAPGTGIDYELTVDERNSVILLPRGTVHLALDNNDMAGSEGSYVDNHGHYVTALKAELPETGGCARWKIVEARGIFATVTAVTPTSTVISTGRPSPTQTPATDSGSGSGDIPGSGIDLTSAHTVLPTLSTVQGGTSTSSTTPLQTPGEDSDSDSNKASAGTIAGSTAAGVFVVGAVVIGGGTGVYCVVKHKKKTKQRKKATIPYGSDIVIQNPASSVEANEKDNEKNIALDDNTDYSEAGPF